MSLSFRHFCRIIYIQTTKFVVFDTICRFSKERENMDHSHSTRKNPSRENCEGIIKRILMTEVLENGSNKHFKNAADFMNYFESLYPASDALTKQVQRAVKALDMPKDEKGYFIVNKTTAQLDQENSIKKVFEDAHVEIHPFEEVETLFLTVEPHLKSYLVHLLETADIFQGKFITICETSNGLLIYTENKKQLHILLNSLTI